MEPPLKSISEMESLIPNDIDSVVLDISTLPKRLFLLAFKKLLKNKKIQNLVITYSKAEYYPELKLCGNPLPSHALQGFGRIEPSEMNHRFIVGVGYVALNIEDLLNSSKGNKLDFLFPFPPASPGFRRNWQLLSKLIPSDYTSGTEIHLISSMDAFEVCEIITSWGASSDLNLVPLGPKPHALGTAMAYIKLNGTAELTYPQPQDYQPNYTEGIHKDEQGKPRITAYCLKHNGNQQF